MTELTTPLDPAKTALLVMDYQPGIIGMLGDAAEPLIERANTALARARDAAAHVGYVRVGLTADEIAAIPPTSRFGQRVEQMADRVSADAPATQVDPRVAPLEGDIVVRKKRVGAFGTTDLDERLRARGVDTLVLAGISTSGVVLSTVRDGADRDYRIVVLADACADPEQDVHAFLTKRIFPRQGEVVNVADLVFNG